jgi:hypothetical protein
VAGFPHFKQTAVKSPTWEFLSTTQSGRSLVISAQLECGDRTCIAISPGGPGLRAARILGAIAPFFIFSPPAAACGKRHAGERVMHYTQTMNTDEIVQAINAEIMRLEQVRALLTDQAAPLKRGAKPQRRKVSAEGRARISAAQKARWAKAKK